MKKREIIPLSVGLFFLVIGVTAKIISPAAKTQFLFSLQRKWEAHWPLDTGRRLPTEVSKLFGPFGPAWVQVEPGVRMFLDPDDLVSKVILENGWWEPNSWRAVEKHLSAGATFVDIGAHIGYYTLKAAVVVGPQGRIIAVEPNPDTLPKLRDNIRASRATMVTVAPVACSDAEATLEFFSAPRSNTGESSLSRTNASQEGTVKASYHVRARPLDDIIAESGVSRVDAIKIDVEGAEFLVLKGAQKTLDRYHPMVLVEVIEPQLQAMGASSAGIVALLRAHGYAARATYGANVEFDPQAPVSGKSN